MQMDNEVNIAARDEDSGLIQPFTIGMNLYAFQAQLPS